MANKIIYKYLLNRYGIVQDIELPRDAVILHVGTQADKVYVWALIDSDYKTTEKRKLRLYYTGDPIENEPLKYIGTCVGGSLVYHLFEAIN